MARIPLLAILPPAIFAGLAGLFFAGMQREDPDALPSTRIGQAAPELTLTALGEGPMTEAEDLAEDGVKLVNFWASWCAPCRVEHPHLETLAEAGGVEIHGINFKDRPGAALGFLEELGSPYATMGADAEGRTARDWGVYGVPETFILDADGEVVLRFAGPITGRVLEETILPAIEAARAP